MRRESTSKLGDGLRTLWIVIVVVTGIPALVPSCTPQRAFGATVDGDPDRLAETGTGSVDRLRARFRETLTLAPLYDEFFVADAARRNAKTGTFADALGDLGVEPGLVDRVDDATLQRAFVAYFDITHLAAAYALATERISDADDRDDVGLPPSVLQRAAGSRHLRAIFDERTDEDAAPKVATFEAFAELVAELESTGDDFRRVVSTFDAPMRTENLLAIGEGHNVVTVTAADASSGYTSLGVPEGERVVQVERDGMFWYDVQFVDGSPKIIAFEIAGD